MNNEREKW